MNTKRKDFNPTVRRNTNVPSLFRGWKEYSEGDFVYGKYHSSFESTYRGKTSTNYRIEVEDCNFYCEDKQGNQIDPVGKIIVLNSAGQLNKLMAEAQLGMHVHVEYAGKKPGKDDTEYHTFSSLEAGWVNKKEDEDNGL